MNTVVVGSLVEHELFLDILGIVVSITCVAHVIERIEVEFPYTCTVLWPNEHKPMLHWCSALSVIS
jgi:hypothetical protein